MSSSGVQTHWWCVFKTHSQTFRICGVFLSNISGSHWFYNTALLKSMCLWAEHGWIWFPKIIHPHCLPLSPILICFQCHCQRNLLFLSLALIMSLSFLNPFIDFFSSLFHGKAINSWGQNPLQSHWCISSFSSSAHSLLLSSPLLFSSSSLDFLSSSHPPAFFPSIQRPLASFLQSFLVTMNNHPIQYCLVGWVDCHCKVFKKIHL